MTSTIQTRETIEQFVRTEFIAMGVEDNQITPDATIDDLGLDSLDIVEISQAAKRKLGSNLTPDDFSDAKTFAEAVNVVLAATAS